MLRILFPNHFTTRRGLTQTLGGFVDPSQKKMLNHLESLPLSEARNLINRNHYGKPGSTNQTICESWLKTKDAPTYMYHPERAPSGQVFAASEVSKLEIEGWFDTPEKFPKQNKAQVLVMFLKKEWKWVIGTCIAIAGLIIASVKVWG